MRKEEEEEEAEGVKPSSVCFSSSHLDEEQRRVSVVSLSREEGL